MTTPASGAISIWNINQEIGNGSNQIGLNWLQSNTKDSIHDLNSARNRSWYQSNAAGNCNNGNCSTACSSASACGYGGYPNCNCTAVQCGNCSTSAINCTNCDSRAWLQPNCNCACTYNCSTTANKTYNCACSSACDCMCCCFTAGAQVLMADRSWQAIETVKVGDFVLGPNGAEEVVRVMRSPVAHRRLMSFAEDRSTQWSEEHSFWARKDGRQWWWAAGKAVWQDEVRRGVVKGLKNNDSHFEGAVDYAHLVGFVHLTPVVVEHAPEDTMVYLPCTKGSPIIVNGYLVGASLDEWGYDYTLLDWDVARGSFLKPVAPTE